MSNTEIVVVGAGVAGLSAALAVAGTGHDVTLVTKAELVESNTYHAQGGIAAAIHGLNRSLERFDTGQIRLPLDGGDVP